MSLASIGVLVSCLLLTGSAVLLSMNINQMMASVEGNNSIQVYCKDEVSSLRAVQIREEIASMDNVEECELVLRDEAVEQMLEQYGDEDGALQSLLGDNFLPHAFKLSMKAVSYTHLDCGGEQRRARGHHYPGVLRRRHADARHGAAAGRPDLAGPLRRGQIRRDRRGCGRKPGGALRQ